MGTSNDQLRRVSVCVCTYKRAEILTALLDQLALVARDASRLATVGVVVVDDDPAGSAESVCSASSWLFPAGLRYFNSAAGNIAVARNHALELGMQVSEWLAIIDDDCRPNEDWLRQLLVVQDRYDADCVTGCCLVEFPTGSPSWLVDEELVEKPSTEPDGSEREIGHLKNTLISTAFIRHHDLRFDLAYGHSGGEDAMFFYAAADAGARHRYAAHAIVSEYVPPSRATLGYQLRRRFWYGSSEARTSIASVRASRRRVVARGAKFCAVGLAGPLVRLARRRPLHLRTALAEIMQGLGRIVGALGITLRHR